MQSKYIFFIGVIVVVGLVMFYSFSDQSISQDYIAQIEAQREEKNTFFRKNSQSPLSTEQKNAFTGLRFYPPDITYRVEALLERFELKEAVQIATSTGETQQYLKYAKAKFKLKGKPHELILLKPLRPMPGQSPKMIFLPFTDDTSGRETYGAGRYLDLEVNEQQATVQIDFNLAYNPYCAYNEVYECPFPPPENYLDTRILAGEKVYKP